MNRDWLERLEREGRVTSKGVNMTALEGGPSLGAACPALLRFQSEEEFQKAVIGLFQSYGWRVAHFRTVCTVKRRKGVETKVWETPVQADGKGFPDLLMLRGTSRVVLELKMPGRRASAEQEAWLRAFYAAGFLGGVYQPEDWALLEELARTGPPPRRSPTPSGG